MFPRDCLPPGRSPKLAAFVARNRPLDGFVGLRPTAPHPIDQFLWSSHIELVASFERAGV